MRLPKYVYVIRGVNNDGAGGTLSMHMSKEKADESFRFWTDTDRGLDWTYSMHRYIHDPHLAPWPRARRRKQ